MVKQALLCGLAFAILFTGCSQSTSANYSEGLFISEVVGSNSDSLVDPKYGSPDWIELYNASDVAINLEGYSISESTGNRYTFPAVLIAPKSYLVIYCCPIPRDVSDAAASAQAADQPAESATPTEPPAAQSGELFTGFKLSRDGTVLSLASANSRLQELTVPALETDISYGYCSDGTYGYFMEPTPGQPNSTASYASITDLRIGEQVQLTISEILPKDVSDTEPYAWIEIYNAGKAPVTLSDYYITENLSNLKKAALPEITLAAGQYAIVKFADQSSEDAVPFKIGENETTIAISDNLGIIVNQITWDADILPGISVGRGEDGNTVYYTVPTPGAQNSGEFLDTADIALAEGRGDVYINELLMSNTFSVIDQFGERSPWVELYNSSGSAVNLSSYALSDDAESLWKWSLPDITLEANSYTIVYLSGKDQKTGELHTSFKLGGADTALYLTNLASQTVQTVTLPTESKDNVSFGLSSDAQWMFYPLPTPMAGNTAQGFTELASVSGESEGVAINEVATVSEAKDGKSDWVELYNGSSSNISLSGCYLSDSKNDTTKWPIGELSIASGGYEVIDEYAGESGSGELSIALSGESLYLFSPQGLLLDKMDTGVLRPGISRGIVAGGAEQSVAFFNDPTPGSANGSDVLSGYCAAPMFSVQGGYQSGAFSLEITTPTAGGAIYYTADGSTPTTGSAQYTGPIPISSTTVIRAITAANGLITSDETVATYLFGDKHALPVICLSIPSGDWSTVVNSSRENKRERAGYVEYYEADGTLGVRFPAGFRVAGAGTIHAAQRSVNLYLRGGYGMSSVTYPFFSNYSKTTFKSLSLRNMGGDQDDTRLKDVFVSMAANGMNVDNAQAKFAVVYLNGKYWGLYEFKENINEEYYADKYGIDPDKVVMVRGNRYNVETGHSDKDIDSLYSLAQKDMNNADNFEKYTSLADSDYFMDYLIAETFFDCYDTYNQKYVHTTDNIMKWRPVFYDFDLCLKRKSGFIFGTFFRGVYVRRAVDSMGKKHETYMYLYDAFGNNAEWEQKFIERYALMLNTTLTTDNLLALYDGLVDSIKDEIPRTVERWPFPRSVSKWKEDSANLREVISCRRDAAKKSLQSYFDLSDERMAQLFPNG